LHVHPPAFSSSQEFAMEISNGHFCATSFFKRPEAFVRGLRAGDGEECGVFPDSAQERGSRIICAYLQVLEGMRGPIAVDSDLPFPKEQIAQAILRELADGPEGDLRRRLEIAYVLLESFIPFEEYRVIEDFKTVSLCAQQIADMGDPTSILRSARIMRKAKGDSAVVLQEKIYKKMMERQLQIQEIREGGAA
jgi:hypothetical protein